METGLTLSEIKKKHTDKLKLICHSYPGEPTRTDSMCAARHKRSRQDPERLTYSSCIDCAIGIEAGEQDQPAPFRKKMSPTRTKSHLCGRCGKPTRDKLCAICKIEMKIEEKKEMEEQTMACKTKDCINTPVTSKGYCRKCYDQIRRQKIKKDKAAPIVSKPKMKELLAATSEKNKIKPAAKPNISQQEYPVEGNPDLVLGIPSSEKPSSDIAVLAQLLLCSQTIEIEIKALLETESFERKNIMDARFRLGEILLESFQ